MVPRRQKPLYRCYRCGFESSIRLRFEFQDVDNLPITVCRTCAGKKMEIRRFLLVFLSVMYCLLFIWFAMGEPEAMYRRWTGSGFNIGDPGYTGPGAAWFVAGFQIMLFYSIYLFYRFVTRGEK